MTRILALILSLNFSSIGQNPGQLCPGSLNGEFRGPVTVLEWDTSDEQCEGQLPGESEEWSVTMTNGALDDGAACNAYYTPNTCLVRGTCLRESVEGSRIVTYDLRAMSSGRLVGTITINGFGVHCRRMVLGVELLRQ